MSRDLTRAQADVEKAGAEVERWGSALAAAEAELAAALAAEPADVDELDVVATAQQRAQGKVEAAGRALHKARERLTEARMAALLAEAADEAAQAKAAERERAGLERKVEALLDQLEALNGARYLAPSIDSREISERVAMGHAVTVRVTNTARLTTAALGHRVRASVLRTTVALGRLPVFFWELDERIDGPTLTSQIDAELIPDSARAYGDHMSVLSG